MGVSRHDIFGDDSSAPLPATPGTYGAAPRGYRLPTATRLGRVLLQVADLKRSIAFYTNTLGLRVLQNKQARALLGAHGDNTPLVELHERAGAHPVPRSGRTGLYHFAILMPDRATFGRLLLHLEASGVRAGAADHLVSEALYLHDPDNLGIEVYVDRPRDAWRRVGRELMMATDPLDTPGLVRAAGDEPWTGMPSGSVIGHLHLHVGDIARASTFYADTLGFDRMVWHYPGALFLSAGGYHHHLGTNTWAGDDATPAAADDAQLLEWTIELPDHASLEAVEESLLRAGQAAERTESDDRQTAFVTRDPWGTPLRISAPR